MSPNATASSTSTSTFSVNFRGGAGPGADGKGAKSAFDTKAGELGVEDVDEPIEIPVLLRRLNSSTAGSGGGDGGGAVGGVFFQRITGGVGGIAGRSAVGKDESSSGHVIVLASTGGSHRHTRLHTFRSEVGLASLTLRSAFSRQAEGAGRGSFIELPGSVDFADLRSCNDCFALRTETGIYYGTMERTGGGGVADAGLLPYDITNGKKGATGVIVAPSSIGVTPHHFVTLNTTNEVKFVNRVARKVIQQEKVDWMSLSQSASSDEYGGGGEILMDVRRHDQIWLRRGRSLVHISSSCEDRDVWKYTLMKCIEAAPIHSTSNWADDGSSALLSEEKHVEIQFELAHSLCTNAVGTIMSPLPSLLLVTPLITRLFYLPHLLIPEPKSQKAVVNAVRAEYHLSQGELCLLCSYFLCILFNSSDKNNCIIC